MNVKELAKAFKALSHPNRLELFIEILRINEKSFEPDCTECFITDIMDSLNIGAPTISHHLKELANSNIISTERRGKFLVAKINKETLDELISCLKFKSEE